MLYLIVTADICELKLLYCKCWFITVVDSPEKNEDSVSLACPSKCIADIGNMDGDASANSFEENVYTPAIISCAKAPLSEKEQKTRTIEVSIGDVQHPEATDGAAEMVQSVPLDATFNNGEISTSQVNMLTGLTEGKIMKDMQLNPVQVHERSTVCFLYLFVLGCQIYYFVFFFTSFLNPHLYL